MNPRYPVYVISKGRWETPYTARALELMRVPYHIVVEPQERDAYASVLDPKKILVLPFSNLGQGSIPARNWVWGHSISLGAYRHWICDDNIRRFYRLNHNKKTPARTGSIFLAAEDFVDRYENVAISGFHYAMFAWRKSHYPPFLRNTRVYSCICIRNDIPYRWRGRYNEDTDLCIRALKDGWCTILFYAFLAEKLQTMTVKGGNTDELYKDDGRLKMAQSLQEQHPDCVEIKREYNRWQHWVDYKRWAGNQLRFRKDIVLPDGVNEYGMKLVDVPVAERTKRGVSTERRSLITTLQWTDIISRGQFRGRTLEDINAMILGKYGVRTRDLPADKFQEVMESL